MPAGVLLRHRWSREADGLPAAGWTQLWQRGICGSSGVHGKTNPASMHIITSMPGPFTDSCVYCLQPTCRSLIAVVLVYSSTHLRRTLYWDNTSMLNFWTCSYARRACIYPVLLDGLVDFLSGIDDVLTQNCIDVQHHESGSCCCSSVSRLWSCQTSSCRRLSKVIEVSLLSNNSTVLFVNMQLLCTRSSCSLQSDLLSFSVAHLPDQL